MVPLAQFNHNMLWFGAGTAYRIRTGDLRLERAVSWASRRMRRGRGALARAAGPGKWYQPSRTVATAAGAARVYSRWVSRKPANRLGDLGVALLAQHEAEVRVRAERLVLGVQPLGERAPTPPPGRTGRARPR